MNQMPRNMLLWAAIALAMVMLFNMFNQQPPSGSAGKRMPYSEFLERVEKGDIMDVLIQGNTISGRTLDGFAFQTYAPHDPGLVSKLLERKVAVKA